MSAKKNVPIYQEIEEVKNRTSPRIIKRQNYISSTNKVMNNIMNMCPQLQSNMKNIVLNTPIDLTKSQTRQKRFGDNNCDEQIKRRKITKMNELSDDEEDYDVCIDDRLDDIELKNIDSKKYRQIKTSYTKGKITMKKIFEHGFNDDDILWFYKNMLRLEDLEGTEMHNLEDRMEQRFKFCTMLKEHGLYDSQNQSSNQIDNVFQKIIKSTHTDKIKKLLITKLQSVSIDSIEEYQKIVNWIETVLQIPSDVKSSKTNIENTISKLYNKLATSFFGMENIIKEIVQAICSILTDPNNAGNILTLVGPPGVGKTSISNMISTAIGMGYGQISCGSINDQATITGHNSTYIGSKVGLLTQCLINNNQLDNVIVLDELDKITDSKILPVLLHVLDKSQNHHFKDAYCPEIDIDLSKNLFVITVNSLENLDNALKDRLKVVHVNGYNLDEKIQICKNHIIPKLIAKTGVNLVIEQNVIKKCIEKISPDISGVRSLERFFSDIYEKLLLTKHLGAEIYDLPKTFNINKLQKINYDTIVHLTNYS